MLASYLHGVHEAAKQCWKERADGRFRSQLGQEVGGRCLLAHRWPHREATAHLEARWCRPQAGYTMLPKSAGKSALTGDSAASLARK